MDPNCHVEPLQKVANAEDLTCAASSQGTREPNSKMNAPCDDASDARIVGLAVLGMGCVNCGTRVRNGLLALDGVVSADVDWERGLALVDYVPARTNVDSIRGAVAAAGNDGHHNYRAKVIP